MIRFRLSLRNIPATEFSCCPDFEEQQDDEGGQGSYDAVKPSEEEVSDVDRGTVIGRIATCLGLSGHMGKRNAAMDHDEDPDHENGYHEASPDRFRPAGLAWIDQDQEGNPKHDGIPADPNEIVRDHMIIQAPVITGRSNNRPGRGSQVSMVRGEVWLSCG